MNDMNEMGDDLLNILLVEDSPGDARLMKEVFRETNDAVQVHVVTDGVEAMGFLLQEGAWIDVPRPDLVLLDLNLPKMDGREVLARVKADDDLKTIPTVILTTSQAEADVVHCYMHQANSYINKPSQLEAFESLVKSINDFWLTKARLPQQRTEPLDA